MPYVITQLLLFTITDETCSTVYYDVGIFNGQTNRHCCSVSIFPQCTNDDCHRYYVYVLLKLISKWVYARFKHVHGYSFPLRLRRIVMAILYSNGQWAILFFLFCRFNLPPQSLYILFPVHLYYESLVAVFSLFTVDKFHSLTFVTRVLFTIQWCLWFSVI